MEIKEELYGFLLNDNVIYNIANRRLLHFAEDFPDHAISLKTVALNETQSRLLTCLLENRKEAVIYKDIILKIVWDELSLSSSHQRLWQTVNELRRKLFFIGLPEDFIANVRGMGYSVNKSIVAALHFK